MYFSLNKKIFYTIFLLMIFIGTLFFAVFIGVFGEKYSQDYDSVFLQNQYVMELLSENMKLKKKLGATNASLSSDILMMQDLNEKQEELDKAKKFNEDLLHKYNEQTNAFVYGSKIIGIGFLLSLISIIILGFLLQRWVINPIHKLNNLSSLVAKGDFSKRITADEKQIFFDEFDTLAKTFNTMVDSIEYNIMEIKSKELFLQSLIDGIPDGIRVIDKNYNIILANKAYIKQMGDISLENQNKCYYAYNYDMPCPEGILTCPLREINQSEFKRLNIIQNLKGKPLSINVAPLLLDKNNKEKDFYIIESIRDLSNDIKFSHEQKVASLGFLATSVAHEMKNNLGSIRMILESILDSYYKDISDDDVQKKYLNMIYNQIVMSVQIPERLLKLAKYSGEEQEIIDINNSIDEVLSLLDYEAKSNGVEIKKIFNSNAIYMLGNEADFKMIILNLAQNSLKAMPSGGLLEVELSKDKNNIVVGVKDTGVGIDNEKMQHIFEPFYSDGKSSKHHNIGLGLAIVKSLVDKVKGTIHVSSEVGKGTAFIIKFPKMKRNKLQN